jgi:hypothetical protein
MWLAPATPPGFILVRILGLRPAYAGLKGSFLAMRALPFAAFAATLIVALPLGATTTAKHSVKSHVTVTASKCEFPAERTAFDIEGLKSQLMVTALACKEQDKYNAFMSRYQPDVMRTERDLVTYFKRSYGREAQKAYDEYITNLADIQEQDGLKSGNAFCANLPAMFDEVMALHSSSELHDFTNAKVIAQPVTFEACAEAPPPAPRKTRHATRAKHA